MADDGPLWLDRDQQHAWRAYIVGTTLLMDRLDADLRSEYKLSLSEYEILVRLSEQQGWVMRMAQLADSMRHSRSRVTHTVARMEDAGLVAREASEDDGRGVQCRMTVTGYALLEKAAPVHVRGVRENLIEVCSREDFLTLGKVMDAVTDRLIGDHPEVDIREGGE